MKTLEAELADATNVEGMSDVRSKLQEQRTVMDQQRKTIVQLQEQLKAMAEQHAVRFLWLVGTTTRTS